MADCFCEKCHKTMKDTNFIHIKMVEKLKCVKPV